MALFFIKEYYDMKVEITPLQFIKIPTENENKKSTLYFITDKNFEFDKINPDLKILKPFEVSKKEYASIHYLWEQQKYRKKQLLGLNQMIKEALKAIRDKIKS